MNIIMGLCGEGSRFRAVGYDIPKYLIAYQGATMLYHSLDTLRISGDVYFVVRQDHLDQYKFLRPMLENLGTVVVAPGLTEGAAQSLLLAKDHIRDMDAPMISINCDQYMKWDSTDFVNELKNNPDTSYVITYTDDSPKCSYVKSISNGLITEVREKEVISSDATAGIYHWAKTSDYFEDAQAMINSGEKTNDEYYVAPVYNYTIERSRPVKIWRLPDGQFMPVGTPRDLQLFVEQQGDFI